MQSIKKSAGDYRPDSSAASRSRVAPVPLVALPQRDGSVTVRDVIDAYMSQYAGRDTTRRQRLLFWQLTLGHLTLTDLLDDDALYSALERLAVQHGRYFFGVDADRRPIYKAKRTTLAPATLNRYQAAISAVFSWAIKKRIAPRGWANPCRHIERRAEHNEVVRFLSDSERIALLAECRRSGWPKLYLLVTLGLTSGARRSELESLRWGDIDVDRAEATISRSKNGDPKVLPLAYQGRPPGFAGEAVKV